MIDTSLALIHAALLIGSAVFALRHYSVSRPHKILAGFLLLWFNLVITGFGLSLFTKLNDLTLYFLLSCLIAVTGSWAVDALLKQGPGGDYNPPALQTNNAPWNFSPLITFSLVILIIAILGSGLIAIFYYPNNPDSIAYRFSRVFLYLGRGNLMHPAQHDPRISFYPFNAALTYLYFAIYKFDGRWFNLFGYASWMVSSLGVYVLGRDMGGSKNGSFLASCIYALSPIVLVLATSTNDEVIAATPVLLGLIFFHRWWHSGRLLDAVLGGIGVGLGAGTKLHIAFFWPVIAAAVFVLLTSLYRRGNLGTFVRERFGHVAVAGLLAALLVFPFMVINYIETQHPVAPPGYAAEILNKPFKAKVALINSSLFSAQLFLSPLPGLVISPHMEFKSRVYERFNAFFNKHFFFWVDKNDHYSSEPYYYFRGIADPVGWWAFEQTEWLGFAPFLVLLGIVLLWHSRDGRKAPLAVWLLASFFVWHFCRSASTKYVETAGAYYSYPFAVCAAGLTAVWDGRQRMRKYSATVVTYLFIAVIFTHALFDLNLFVCNVKRNLASLVLASCPPEKIEKLPLPSVIKNSLMLAGHVKMEAPMSPAVASALLTAQKIHLVYTRWEFPLFSFMYRNPAARYTSSGELEADDALLNVLLYSARSEFAHIPIQVTGEEKVRLTALGSIATEFGNEYVFARGNKVHEVYPVSSGFIVLHPALKYRDDGSTVTEVTFSPAVMGTDEADHFEYRLSQHLSDGKEYSVADWFPRDQLDRTRKLPVPSAGGYLKVGVRSAEDRDNIFESFLPLKKGEDIKPLNVNAAECSTKQSVKNADERSR